MLRMLIALVLSAAIVLVSGPKVIPVLRKLKFGQTIYDLGPQSHKAKQGTPTMGGVMIAAGALIAAVVCTMITPFYLAAPMGFLAVHFYNGEENTNSRLVNYLAYPAILLVTALVGILL